MRDSATAHAWVGREVDDVQGRRLGSIAAVYAEEATGLLAWVCLRLEDYGGRLACVPASDLAVWPARAVLGHRARTVELSPALFETPATPAAALVWQLRRHYGEPTVRRAGARMVRRSRPPTTPTRPDPSYP